MSTPEITWDKSKPIGSSTRGREIDNYMRSDKDTLEDALDREHTFPGTYGSTAGKHVPGGCGVLDVDTKSNLGTGQGVAGAISYATDEKKLYRDTGSDISEIDLNLSAYAELADLTSLSGTYAAHAADSTIHFTEGSIDHTNITNIGTNTHAQIDTHIASSANPHSVDEGDILPSQSGHSGEYLTTNGSTSSWSSITTGDIAQQILAETDEYTTSTTSYVEKTSFSVYIQSNATTLTMATLLKISSSASTATASFIINGSTSSTATSSSTSYSIKTCSINVSALSGWYTVSVQLKITVPGYSASMKNTSFRLS